MAPVPEPCKKKMVRLQEEEEEEEEEEGQLQKQVRLQERVNRSEEGQTARRESEISMLQPASKSDHKKHVSIRGTESNSKKKIRLQERHPERSSKRSDWRNKKIHTARRRLGCCFATVLTHVGSSVVKGAALL